MKPDAFKLEIVCDDQAVQELRTAFKPEDQPRFVKRRNLAGEAAAWIVMATLTGRALPHILQFMIKWRELGRVKLIKLGDIEIQNPSAEVVQQLLGRLDPTSGQQHGT